MDTRKKIVDFLLSRGAWYILVVVVILGFCSFVLGAYGVYRFRAEGGWNLLISGVALIFGGLFLLALAGSMLGSYLASLTSSLRDRDE